MPLPYRHNHENGNKMLNTVPRHRGISMKLEQPAPFLTELWWTPFLHSDVAIQRFNHLRSSRNIRRFSAESRISGGFPRLQWRPPGHRLVCAEPGSPPGTASAHCCPSASCTVGYRACLVQHSYYSITFPRQTITQVVNVIYRATVWQSGKVFGLFDYL